MTGVMSWKTIVYINDKVNVKWLIVEIDGKIYKLQISMSHTVFLFQTIKGFFCKEHFCAFLSCCKSLPGTSRIFLSQDPGYLRFNKITKVKKEHTRKYLCSRFADKLSYHWVMSRPRCTCHGCTPFLRSELAGLKIYFQQRTYM